jgi:hypothetical protein
MWCSGAGPRNVHRRRLVWYQLARRGSIAKLIMVYFGDQKDLNTFNKSGGLSLAVKMLENKQ